MGREEQAKAERADLRRAVVDEALGRVSELEEKIAAHKKTINQQGRALEALANVITAIRGELAALETRVAFLSLPLWKRSAWRLRFLWVWLVTATLQGALRALEALRRLFTPAPKLTIARVCDDAPVVEHTAGSLGEVPKIDHVHQYVKDGPFMYRCSVDGCDRRATLEEIGSEAEYLKSLDKKATA